jgi:hypothetical protein
LFILIFVQEPNKTKRSSLQILMVHQKNILVMSKEPFQVTFYTCLPLFSSIIFKFLLSVNLCYFHLITFSVDHGTGGAKTSEFMYYKKLCGTSGQKETSSKKHVHLHVFWYLLFSSDNFFFCFHVCKLKVPIRQEIRFLIKSRRKLLLAVSPPLPIKSRVVLVCSLL